MFLFFVYFQCLKSKKNKNVYNINYIILHICLSSEPIKVVFAERENKNKHAFIFSCIINMSTFLTVHVYFNVYASNIFKYKHLFLIFFCIFSRTNLHSTQITFTSIYFRRPIFQTKKCFKTDGDVMPKSKKKKYIKTSKTTT